jgi:hypothetical protein
MALAASPELILFLLGLGGDDCPTVVRLAKSLPEIKGLPASSLKYCLRFFPFCSSDTLIGQQAVDQLPWGNNIQIFTKCGRPFTQIRTQ